MTATLPTIHTPVEYDDSRHLYGLGMGMPGFIRYWSSTQVVEKFYEKFDARPRAEAYAAKHGGTPEYWLEQWAQKRDKSLVRGNTIHDANEITLQARMIDQFEGRTLPVHGEVIPDEHPWIERPDGVYTERKLWHHGYRLAGRADKVILETIQLTPHWGFLQREERIAHIEDYKTNGKLDKISYQFRNGGYKMMKPPIAHLMDCTFIHYELQLSLYMLMLEYQGFRPGKMTIIHYPHPTDENPNPEREYHDARYLKREAVLMLTYLNNRVA